jgi:hypothetical protein
MRITLVAYVPDNSVLGTVKHAVERDCQFYYAKIARKMTAVPADDFYNSASYFTGKFGKFFFREFFDI